MPLTPPLPGVRALLLDLEGTVCEAGRPLPRAADALAALSARALPHCFVTNTTSRPRSKLASELSATGIAVPADRIFTAPLAARRYLLDRGLTRCHLMVAPAVLEDFVGVEHDEDSREALVVGDVGDGFTYSRLNHAFRLLLEGARFVTLARNRYYRSGGGLVLDQGPFVAALEVAAGREAVLVGKPAAEFFRPALELLGVPAEETAIVGDDIEADVGGAMALRMRGILVRTGKFRKADLARSTVHPDAVVDSIADVPALLRLED